MSDTPGIWKVSDQDDFNNWQSRFYTSQEEAQKDYENALAGAVEVYGDEEGEDPEDYVGLDFIAFPKDLEELCSILNRHGCWQ